MEHIFDARGRIPDWFDWLRDVVVIGMTAEKEEVIRNHFPLICLLFNFFSLF
jgi:hypothetical protein